MGDNILVILKDALQSQDMLEVLKNVGGYEDRDGMTGHMSEGRAHIWVSLDVYSLREIALDHPEGLKQIGEKLGGQPQTCIVVEIDSACGSQKLATAFAYACCEIWTCIVFVFDVNWRIFSKEEIAQMYHKGKTFE